MTLINFKKVFSILQYECKVQECEDNFAKLNRVIRREIARFDAQRVLDFSHTIVQYFDTLADTQQKVFRFAINYLN